MTSSTATIALRWVSTWRGRRPRMSRTLKVWVRSAVSVTALLLFAAQAAAACVLYYAPANSPTSTPVRYNVCDAAASFPTGTSEGDLAYDQATDTLYVWDGAAWDATGGGGGAPTTAQYWVGAPDGGLSAEKDLSALSTGLVINTGGTPSAYTGATCTNQVLTALSASGAGTCTTATLASAQFANQGTTTTLLHGNAAGNPSWGAVALASDVSGVLGDANGGTGSDTTVLAANRMFVTTGTAYSPFAIPDCDDSGGQHLNYNDAAGGGPAFSCGTSSSGGTTPTGTGFRHVTAGVEDAAADLVTLTSATEVAPNQGTTTTVLHGNAAGQASFASVDLTNDTSSVLPLAKLTDDASSGLCLLSGGGGDPAWTTCPGGGGGLSYAQVAAAALAGF